MKYHKYTPEDDAYIIANYLSSKIMDIGEHLGLSRKQVITRMSRLRCADPTLPCRRYAKFTEEDDDYIIAHTRSRTCFEMGYHLGRGEDVVSHQVRKLRKQAERFGRHDLVRALTRPTEPDIHPPRITDGYDTVPWHLRIAGRNQGLTLDMEPCYDEPRG